MVLSQRQFLDDMSALHGISFDVEKATTSVAIAASSRAAGTHLILGGISRAEEGWRGSDAR